MSNQLSWKPVRHGVIYCSPACGLGCTFEEHQEAELDALKLANRLSAVDTDVKGGRWKVRVWENLGWHYSVSKGSVSVHEHGFYTAYFNVAGPWGGNHVRVAGTPELAIKRLLNDVREQLKPMVKLAKRLEKK
jgi:hypothetical protein